MLVGDSVSFIKDLTPAVFTSCLSTKHGQFIRRKHEVVIALPIREDKVRLLFVFCYSLLLEDYLIGVNYSWICLGNANLF